MLSGWPGEIVNEWQFWFGLFFLLVGVVMSVRSWRFIRYGVHTIGVVIDTTDKGRGLGYPIIRFVTLNGKAVVFTERINTLTSYSIGQEVPVLYDPANPEHAGIDRVLNLWIQPAIGIAGGAALLLWAVSSLPK